MLKRIASLLLISFVAACGGSGDAGSPLYGGTKTTTTATTADLLLTASSATLSNSGAASVKVTATALDASRNTLSSVPVTLSADGGAVLGTVSGSATAADGTVTASLGIGDSPANRLITITAVSGSITKTATVQVTGTTITATLVPVISPSTAATIQYHVVNSTGTPLANQAVQVLATGLTPTDATGVTDTNGYYTFSYTSPAATGTYSVVATIAGVTNTQSVTVQPSSSVPAVTATITSASISANPSVVPINSAGSTANQSQIRVLFLGANNLPIQNVRAKFDLNGDKNSIGGTFSAGNSILYSDANGVVTTSYIPGTRSSPTDGVSVRVCYGKTDIDTNLTNCLTSQVVTLTVAAEPLGVTIGTNGTIIVNTLTYVKQFVVSVADAAGVAKSGVTLTASVDLPRYRKGHYVLNGTAWAKAGGGDAAVCPNEDTNRNGVLDSGIFVNVNGVLVPGEDYNNDGVLWPRKPDVTVTLLSSTTADDGTAVLQVQYAQDHGSWVDALITVSASGVAGSEGRATYLLAPVPVDAASINNAAASPAFMISPYGVANVCTNPN